MTTASAIPANAPESAKYQNGAEWLRALGDVPLERVIMDPPPGTATEQHLIHFVDGDDKRLCELIDGTLVEKPVGTKESIIAGLLITALNNHIRPRKLGLLTVEAGPFRVRPRRVRLPDIAFISTRDMPGGKLPDEAISSLIPSLAIEVISKGNTKAEMRQKVQEYFAAGTSLVWLIYPKTKTVDVYETDSDAPARVLNEQDALDGGSVLPGFSFPINSLFEGID